VLPPAGSAYTSLVAEEGEGEGSGRLQLTLGEQDLCPDLRRSVALHLASVPGTKSMMSGPTPFSQAQASSSTIWAQPLVR
jgi:hypothetical protein